jgi:hypothetical protein
MNWKAWKLGLLVAGVASLLTAGTAWSMDNLSLRAFVGILCSSMATNFGAFLFRHPPDQVAFDPPQTKTTDKAS